MEQFLNYMMSGQQGGAPPCMGTAQMIYEYLSQKGWECERPLGFCFEVSVGSTEYWVSIVCSPGSDGYETAIKDANGKLITSEEWGYSNQVEYFESPEDVHKELERLQKLWN